MRPGQDDDSWSPPTQNKTLSVVHITFGQQSPLLYEHRLPRGRRAEKESL